MLVLMRRVDETIVIDPENLNIRVTVVSIRGDKARIGIEAPLSVVVHREEVLEAIERKAREEGVSRDGV